MGLTNVAGVFSRYFIVGFFLPAFFALVVLAQVVAPEFLPSVYEDAKAGAQIAMVGGGALLIGLVLLGLNHEILRLYEGYPLQGRHSLPLVRQIHALLISGQRRRLGRLDRLISDKASSDVKRFDAEWRRDQCFPHDSPDLLLPTAFGNAVRAFERHSWTRWHLNSIGAWPYVENLLSSQESQLLADAKGDVAFFVNGSLVATVAGLAFAASTITHDMPGAWYIDSALCLVPFVVSALAYRAAVGAATRWGSVVRASLDLHRHELYARLGVRQPRDFSDERTIAWHLNAALLIGTRLSDEIAANPEGDYGQRNGISACLSRKILGDGTKS